MDHLKNSLLLLLLHHPGLCSYRQSAANVSKEPNAYVLAANFLIARPAGLGGTDSIDKLMQVPYRWHNKRWSMNLMMQRYRTGKNFAAKCDAISEALPQSCRLRCM